MSLDITVKAQNTRNRESLKSIQREEANYPQNGTLDWQQQQKPEESWVFLQKKDRKEPSDENSISNENCHSRMSKEKIQLNNEGDRLTAPMICLSTCIVRTDIMCLLKWRVINYTMMDSDLNLPSLYYLPMYRKWRRVRNKPNNTGVRKTRTSYSYLQQVSSMKNLS